MKKEEKLELLLKIQNDPEQFTEEEIRQLMEDDECRQFYEQMVRAADSVFADDAMFSSEDGVETAKERTLIPLIRKVAAALVGILMLSGIAYAAIHYTRNREAKQQTEYAVTEQSTNKVAEETTMLPDSSVTVQPKTFENVPLKDIVGEIAAYHHLTVEVRNSEAAALRLYYPWNPKMAFQQVVEELNRFEKVQLTVKENVIVIE